LLHIKRMKSTRHLLTLPSRRLLKKSSGAFTLSELLVVIAIMAILSALVAPALRPPTGVEQASYGISDVVQASRSYAVANNTYVYLGFVEYNGAQSANGPQSPGNGRVIVAAVASTNGTRGYSDTSAANAAASWSGSYSAGANLVTVIPPTFFENTHLIPLGTPPATGSMARPDPGGNTWCLGSSSFTTESQTPFSLPLGSSLNGGKYNFNQVLIFFPDGSVYRQTSDSGLGLVSPLYLEVGMQPNQGSTANYAAISINGTTGASKVYRP